MIILNKSGAKSSVAYEDIRLRPKSNLARFLMEGTLEDVFESALEGRDDSLRIDDTGALSSPMIDGADIFNVNKDEGVQGSQGINGESSEEYEGDAVDLRCQPPLTYLRPYPGAYSTVALSR